VTIASHQLRTPLTAIKGYSSMLLEGTYGKVPAYMKKPLRHIFQSANAMVHMISNYLTLSRIERKKIEYKFEESDLKEMVKSIFDEFKAVNATKMKKLDLELKIEKKEDYKAIVDAEKLREVFYNLVDNAMKYTYEGFIKIFLGKDDKTGNFVFKVEDSGIGIRADILKTLFQKFSQGEENGAGAVVGLGLGLYVAKEIVTAHKGKIWAESKGEGRGSTFYVEIPASSAVPKEDNSKELAE